jgi:FkbM family methyltransferase
VAGLVHPGVRDGYFVDVGAWDAVRSSNSKALEELGWQGICVEPFPRNWRDRSCQLFREVAYGVAGEKVEFKAAGVRGGVAEHVDPENPQVQRSRTVEFTTTTLADIFERANAPAYIHYVNVDTEGAELQILKGFPFDRHRVGAFTIEHNYEEPKRTQIRELLESHGYRHAREQAVDDWYVLAGPGEAGSPPR